MSKHVSFKALGFCFTLFGLASDSSGVCCVQLWCAAGVDLTGWKGSSQDPTAAKALPSSGDPLNAEKDADGKKSSHSSPEKRKVGWLKRRRRRRRRRILLAET